MKKTAKNGKNGKTAKVVRKKRVEVSLHAEGKKLTLTVARNSKKAPVSVSKRLTGRDVRWLLKALAERL